MPRLTRLDTTTIYNEAAAGKLGIGLVVGAGAAVVPGSGSTATQYRPAGFAGVAVYYSIF